MNSIIPGENLLSKIFLIRGKKVMLGNHHAELYQVTTGNLMKAVKRNIKRFPDDFMFQLTDEEFSNLKFHFGSSNWGGIRYNPYAFTEQKEKMINDE